MLGNGPGYTRLPTITGFPRGAPTIYNAFDGTVVNGTFSSRRWLVNGVAVGTGGTIDRSVVTAQPAVNGVWSLVLESTAGTTVVYSDVRTIYAPSVISGGGTPSILTQPIVIIQVADSQYIRGAGTGTLSMDDSRANAVAAKTQAALAAAGYPVSFENMWTANNTSGDPALFAPERLTPGSWIYATGTNPGGMTFSRSASGGQMVLTFPNPVDRILLWTPRNTSITSILNYNLDAAGAVPINENGADGFIPTLITTAKATHVLNLARDATSTGSAFLQIADAWDSTTNSLRIVSLAARDYSTTDWLTQDTQYRAFSGLKVMVAYYASLGARVIVDLCLGTNDLRSGGAGNSVATYQANIQSIVDGVVTAGAEGVVLTQSLPINPANEGSFTQAQQLAANQALLAANPTKIKRLSRPDISLGSWSSPLVGAPVDALHWNATAQGAVGAAQGASYRQAASLN